MTRSMTGFGRAQSESTELSISVELKSVNHRYFELSTRCPRQYSFLEEKIKSYLQTRVSRGKVECNISLLELDAGDVEVQVNHGLVKAYLKALNELVDNYDVRNDISAMSLSRFSDVLAVHKVPADEEAIWNAVLPVLEAATDQFIAMREREGTKLKEDIFEKADHILELTEFIEARSPETVREYNEKIRARIRDLIGDVKIDEQRILTEAAVYADKVAVDEETVRLHSHIEQLKAMFEEEGAIGRKLDFLVQEINREANTIGSKASDLEITSRVLDIKGNVEKIREQVQNIE